MSVVLWSGGVDSTLVLWDLLHDGWQTYRRAGVDEEQVRAISFVTPRMGAIDEQRLARKRLALELRSRGRTMRGGELSLASEVAATLQQDDGLVYPQLWLALGSATLRTNEDLYVGWTKGDDALKYRDTLFELFEAHQRIGRKRGRLILPLEGVEKSYAIGRLRELELLDLTWTCERPDDGRPCLDCPPCVTRDAATREAIA